MVAVECGRRSHGRGQCQCTCRASRTERTAAVLSDVQYRQHDGLRGYAPLTSPRLLLSILSRHLLTSVRILYYVSHSITPLPLNAHT